MFYLLYGTDEFIRKQTLEKIKQKNKFEELDINYYNYTDTTMKNILEDASTFPLFSNQKMIIVYEANLFSGNVKQDEETKMLENYLQNLNTNTILIFISSDEKVDTRKKIVKLLNEKKMLIECKQPDNLQNLIKEQLEGYDISYNTILKLIDRVGNDGLQLISECEKLKLYKIEDKKIEDKDLEIVTKNIDTNIFKFIDDIINKKHDKVIEVYKELVNQGEEIIAIVIMISNQVRLLYQVKELLLQGYTEKEIAESLEIHPYRVKLAHEKSRQYKSSTLLKLLEQLADLDYQIKTGEVNPQIGLELFLLST